MDSSINTVVAENCSLKIMEFQVLAIGHSRMGSSMIKGRDGTRASRYPGAAEEVAGPSFDDKRMSALLKLLIERLAQDPKRSLPDAFDSAGLEGAYRFFSNPKVTLQGILAPHIQSTRL